MSLSTVEKWYARQCNGEWEHRFGVDISTIDEWDFTNRSETLDISS